MQIEGNVEALDRLPERPILRPVVVHHHPRIPGLRIAVDQRAFESELLDAALQLLRRDLRLPSPSLPLPSSGPRRVPLCVLLPPPPFPAFRALPFSASIFLILLCFI